MKFRKSPRIRFWTQRSARSLARPYTPCLRMWKDAWARGLTCQWSRGELANGSVAFAQDQAADRTFVERFVERLFATAKCRTGRRKTICSAATRRQTRSSLARAPTDRKSVV